MNRQPEHLSDAEIEAYLSESSEYNPDFSSQGLEAHLDSCDDCRVRVLSAFPKYSGLRVNDRISPGPDPECRPEELDAIAARMSSGENVTRIIRHASDCLYCGPKLKEYLESYSDEVAEEDRKALAQSSAASWRKQMVKKIMRETGPETAWWKRLLHPPLLRIAALGGAGATLSAACILTVPAFIESRNLKQAEQLWEEAAASHDRHTPIRLTSAPYSAYKVQLGPGDNLHDNFHDDLNLLRAKVLVESRMSARPGKLEPRWLHLRARIALLEGGPANLAVAEKALKEALAITPDSASLKIDLAAAYYEQDFQANSASPILARTIDLLNGVLKTPGLSQQEKAVAVFNLANAYRKTELLPSEAATWREYQTLDSDGDWAEEARDRLREADERAPKPRPDRFEEASYFLKLPLEKRQGWLEQYMDVAFRKWLYPAIEDPTSNAARAIHMLAEMAASEPHRDPLLKDLLARLGKGDLPAIADLSAALEDNMNDNLSEEGAALKSSRAARWFARRRNLPGELLARFENAYSLRRSMQGNDCRAALNAAAARLPVNKYHWLEGQLEIEKAQCANLMTDYEQAQTHTDMSGAIAMKFEYPELALRIKGIEAGMKRLRGKYADAWQECMEGLHMYWSNPQSPERLYQFYSVLGLTAKDMRLPNAREALLRQGIAIREQYFKEDIPLLAALHMRLADVMREGGAAGTASSEVASEANKALQLVREAPDKSTAEKFLLYGQIDFAGAKLKSAEKSATPEKRREEASLALQAIAPVSRLLKNQDDFVQLDFYRVQANAKQQLGEIKGAIEDYHAALERSERALSAIKDDASRTRWISATDEIDRGLTRTLLRNKEYNKALYVWERLRTRSLAADNTDDPPLDRLEINNTEFVPAAPQVHETHVIYAAFPDGVQIWTVNFPVIKGVWVDINQDRLGKLVKEFADQCAERKKTSDQALELYSKLLHPIIADLPLARPVVVELDQALARLPLEALPLPETSEDFFGTRYQVVRSPGIFARKALREPQPPPAQKPFLFVDPSRLPGHTVQADAVRRAFPATRIMDARDIERSQITQALAYSYGFHFTGHGTGRELELRHGLSLTANDFPPLAVNKVQMAVLAACSTGATSNGALDADGLVRSFLLAGVPTIISSQWNVDAADTAELMSIFYSYLGKGDSPAEALRKARREMATSRDKTKQLPYTWAAFTLTGRIE